MRQKALFYPQAQQVEACTLDESGNLAIQTIQRGGILTAEDLLPGFSLPVQDVFRENLS